MQTSKIRKPFVLVLPVLVLAAGLLWLPQPTITSSSVLTLTIDASHSTHRISPLIYGMNFADPALIRELRLPVNRWGGNATTRYNWQNDTSNRASDWYFENIPNPNDHPGDLPDGSSSDQFVEGNRAAGAESILTLPLIGWTPKSRDFACAFRVSIYGGQQAVDPWQPDCGNGIWPDGSLITGNDPRDTSLPIDEGFVQDWLEHLVERFGSAEGGGVRFYNLDNEPMLWHYTHRDVHPEPVGYDELRARTILYAAAVKTVDPQAQILGPTVWGWTAYFYSALDQAGGGLWWLSPPDQKAHGDVPLVAWYLQQMNAFEQEHAVRILDYLDLHYYPQAGGVALQPAGDAATQALRLRTTRSLWDPSYTDESWIDEPVMLIPRMREWVENNYPGTKLAITEYNFGGLEHINGAIAQADVLGIFGREGVDLATLWVPPAIDQPGAYAFRMYRNYDGKGGSFGNLSLAAESSDQGSLSVYASQRERDQALTILVINKSGNTLTSHLQINGLTQAAEAAVYRYSPTKLDAIACQTDQPVPVDGFEAHFPADSITLFVLSTQHGSEHCSQAYLPQLMH
jgi:hypothetical protein